MDKEPLLSSSSSSSSSSSPILTPPLPISSRRFPSNSSVATPPCLCTLPEDGEISPSRLPFSPSSSSLSPAAYAFKERLIFGPTDNESLYLLPSSSSSPPPPSPPYPLPTIQEASSISVPSYDDSLLWPPSSSSSSSTTKPKSNLHRSRTAPAMAGINNASNPHGNSASPPAPNRPSVVRNAVVFLFAYLAFGVAVYAVAPSNFSAATTNPIVDALYFCIVTMCTIGYGDITPATPFAKLFSITFVLIGFGFVDILLSAMVSYVLDLQESLLLTAVSKNGAGKRGGRHRGDVARHYIVDVKKGRMRIRMKVALALGVVVLCVGVGAFVLRFVERLGWIDAFYLSVMSVTTVGYGDRAFKTLQGRLFASAWLLLSTLAVARAFLYLAEARIDKRHRMIAKWVLCRDMTVSEFLAADIDNNGFVTKSEFVIYKLKEMGTVSEKDILQICEQFDRLDSGKCGKITLSDLIGSHL